MAQCSTTSGPYRCGRDVNAQGEHEGPCEAQAREYTALSLFAAKNGWWWDACPKHKLTKHYAKHGGKCGECVDAEKKLGEKAS